jgi:hypothetical protein
MRAAYRGATADIVSEETINNYCKEDLNEFNKLLVEKNVDLQELAYEEVYDEVEEVYTRICKTFYEKTNIHIRVNYHSSEYYGSPADEVDGVFWEVYNKNILNPNISDDMHKLIKHVHYVEYS